MEYDIREELFNRDFLQGYTNERVVRGLTMTPLLEKQVFSDDTFTWFEEDMSVEEAVKRGLQHNPRKLPEGAVMEEIRVEGFSEKHGTVEKRGFQITLSKNKLERKPEAARSILNRIGKLSYSLGRWVEGEVFNKVKSEAIKGGVTVSNSQDLAQAPPILGESSQLSKALTSYELAYDLDDFDQELNTLIYHKRDLKGIRDQLNDNEIVTQNRLVEGWKNGKAFDYLDITHMKGNMFQNQDELIGFDRNVDFGTVYYTEEEGAYNPDVITGMEAFSPLVNVTVQPPDEYLMPKKYTIRMLTGVGVSIETPRALLYKNGLTS